MTSFRYMLRRRGLRLTCEFFKFNTRSNFRTRSPPRSSSPHKQHCWCIAISLRTLSRTQITITTWTDKDIWTPTLLESSRLDSLVIVTRSSAIACTSTNRMPVFDLDLPLYSKLIRAGRARMEGARMEVGRITGLLTTRSKVVAPRR